MLKLRGKILSILFALSLVFVTGCGDDDAAAGAAATSALPTPNAQCGTSQCL